MKKLICLLLLLIGFRVNGTTNFAASVTIPSLGLSNVTAVIVIGTPMRVSDYTNRPVPLDTDLLLLADPLNKTNANVTFLQVKQNMPSQSTNFSTIFSTGQLYATNPWAGPTNSITLGLTNHYYYIANTPCAVTGFVYNTSVANTSVLTISNAAPTNITFTINSNPVQEDTSTTYTITNGFVIKCWMEYADRMTNHVARVFRH